MTFLCGATLSQKGVLVESHNAKMHQCWDGWCGGLCSCWLISTCYLVLITAPLLKKQPAISLRSAVWGSVGFSRGFLSFMDCLFLLQEVLYRHFIEKKKFMCLLQTCNHISVWPVFLVVCIMNIFSTSLHDNKNSAWLTGWWWRWSWRKRGRIICL